MNSQPLLADVQTVHVSTININYQTQHLLEKIYRIMPDNSMQPLQLLPISKIILENVTRHTYCVFVRVILCSAATETWIYDEQQPHASNRQTGTL